MSLPRIRGGVTGIFVNFSHSKGVTVNYSVMPSIGEFDHSL